MAVSDRQFTCRTCAPVFVRAVLHCAAEEYLDEALSDEEAQARQVLTCQMVPTSDCVVDVPVKSSGSSRATTSSMAVSDRQFTCRTCAPVFVRAV
jgi:hypothetical protein